jgi:hypothetical protein
MKGIGTVLFIDYELAKVYYEIQGNEGTLTVLKKKRLYKTFEEQDLLMQLKCQDGGELSFTVWEKLEEEKYKIKVDWPVPDKSF